MWLPSKTYAEELDDLKAANERAKTRRKKEWHQAREIGKLKRRVAELEAEQAELLKDPTRDRNV